MLELREHAANLAVLAFAQRDPQPGAGPLLLDRFDAPRLDLAVAEVNPLEQLLQIVARWLAGDLHEIGLSDAETRMHEPIGQIAVVGEQQQSFAVLVEPAHGVDPLGDLGHQVDGARPAGGVAVGAQVAARFVDEPIDAFFRRIGWPSTVTVWSGPTRVPSLRTTTPSTAMRRARISSSQCRREPWPAWARYLLRRSMRSFYGMIRGIRSTSSRGLGHVVG